MLIYAVKADFIEQEAFLESVAIATVEKKNELIGKPQLHQELKNTFSNEFIVLWVTTKVFFIIFYP